MNATFTKACKKAAKFTDENFHSYAILALAEAYDSDIATGAAMEMEAMIKLHAQQGYATLDMQHRRYYVTKLLLADIAKTLGDDARKLAYSAL